LAFGLVYYWASFWGWEVLQIGWFDNLLKAHLKAFIFDYIYFSVLVVSSFPPNWFGSSFHEFKQFGIDGEQ